LTGQLAQLVRAFGSHPKGHRFESCIAQEIERPEPVKDIKLNHKASEQPVVKCTLPRGAFLV
jgi:hypothetical protein